MSEKITIEISMETAEQLAWGNFGAYDQNEIHRVCKRALAEKHKFMVLICNHTNGGFSPGETLTSFELSAEEARWMSEESTRDFRTPGTEDVVTRFSDACGDAHRWLKKRG